MTAPPVPPDRVRALNGAPVRPDGDHVLYWMVACRRTRDSFPLQRAVERSRELGKPVLALEALRVESPGDEMFLILGGDQAAALPSWHEPERVLEHATVAVVERTGWTRNGIGIRIGRLRGADRVRYLDMPLIQISSTALRRRVREGVPIRYLVPPAVERFIEERGLYAPAAGTVTANGATRA